MQLSEELGPYWEAMGPLVRFFCLPEQEQMALLPALDKRKYDFPDGDLSTDSALEVLVNGYEACLNSSLIRLLIMQDESNDSDIDELADTLEELLGIVNKLADDYCDMPGHAKSLRSPDWERLRQLSRIAQQKLQLQSGTDGKMVKSCVDYWLHP